MARFFGRDGRDHALDLFEPAAAEDGVVVVLPRAGDAHVLGVAELLRARATLSQPLTLDRSLAAPERGRDDR